MLIHIGEADMVADSNTKYVKLDVWLRHMHYILNLPGDPPRLSRGGLDACADFEIETEAEAEACLQGLIARSAVPNSVDDSDLRASVT